MNLRLILLGLLLIAVIVVIGICTAGNMLFRHRVVVVNATQQVLESVEVSVWHQTMKFHELVPSQQRKLYFFPDNFDSGFRIEAKFKNGRTISAKEGYVSTGYLFPHEWQIVVNDNSIRVQELR